MFIPVGYLCVVIPLIIILFSVLTVTLVSMRCKIADLEMLIDGLIKFGPERPERMLRKDVNGY